MARYIKDSNGNLICTAGGTRTWICTQAEHDRRVAAGTAPNNCMVNITDDYTEADKATTRTVTGAGVTAYITEWGKMVTITFGGTLSGAVAQWGKIIQGLPKLDHDFYFSSNGYYMSASGNLTAQAALTSGTSVSGSLTYITVE